MSKCREEFERHFDPTPSNPERLYQQDGKGGYKYLIVDNEWITWQAAWKRCEEVGKDDKQ